MLILTIQVVNCTQHSQADPTKCVQCHCAYELSADGTRCVPRPTADASACLPILYCYKCDSSNPYYCSSCAQAFALSDDKCLCENRLQNCIIGDLENNTCETCYFTYGPYKNKCRACSEGCANCTFTEVGGNFVETCLSCCAAGKKLSWSYGEDVIEYYCPSNTNYTLLNGKCSNCADEAVYGPNCLSCQGNKCTLCAGSAYFVNAQGKCYDCGQYCIKCDVTGCLNCQSQVGMLPVYKEAGQCFTCNDTSKYGQYCKQCSLTSCINCNQTGYSVIDDKCQKCNGVCLACSKVDVCVTCPANYYKDNGVCRDCSISAYGQNCMECNASACLKCKSTYNQTVINGKCTVCEEGCQECNGNNCTKCKAGMWRDIKQGKCFNCSIASLYGDNCGECNYSACTKCNVSSYTVDNGKCRKCPTLCATCNATDCLSCTSDRVSLSNGMCYDCSLSKYGPHCQTCDASVCTTCTSYTYIGMVGNQCVSCPSYCYTCSDDGCIKCVNSSLVIQSGNRCIHCSTFGSYCTRCDATKCTECNKTDYGIDVLGNCSRCSSNCAACTAGKCTKCYDGYKNVSGVCEKCPANCTSCTVDGCTNCQSGYGLVQGKCLACNDAFGASCISCSQSACLKCDKENYGNNLDGGYCYDCSVYEQCTTCSATACVTCNSGYFKVAGKCQKCTDNCAVCANSTACQTCSTGYFKNSGKCYNCSLSKYGEGCIACNETHCTDCIMGEYAHSVDNGKCVKCGPLCMNCTADACIKCLDEDYGISRFDKKCWNCSLSEYGLNCLKCNDTSCTECGQGRYNVVNGKCAKCPSNCYVCTDGDCSLCDYNYYPRDGYCYTCTYLYGSMCESCNETHCKQCKEQDSGYSLIDGKCINCTAIFSHCDQCTNTSCIKCPSGFRLTAGNCTKCPTNCRHCDEHSCIPSGGGGGGGSYEPDCFNDSVLVNGSCLKCNEAFGSGCDICNTSECLNCSEALTGTHFLAEGYCNDCTQEDKYGVFCRECNKTKCFTCTTGYYLTDEGKCVACAVGCDECTQEKCTKCSGQANTSYPNGIMCKACPELCETCISGSKCLSCVYGDYYLDGICKECSTISGCDTCTIDGVCTHCAKQDNGASFVNGNCIDCHAKYTNHCEYCDETHCTKCPEHFYVDKDGKCQQCNSGCTSCSTVDFNEYCNYCVGEGAGTSAVNGYCVNCVEKYGELCRACNSSGCTSCNYPGYTIYGNGTCAKCPENCTKCKAESCTACVPGNYSLIPAEIPYCKQCSVFGSNCIKCDADKCTECASSNYFINGTHCQPCSNSCKTCQGIATNCTSCYNYNSGVTLINTSITTTVPAGNETTEVTVTTGECYNCESPFGSCSICTKEACTKCNAENYYVSTTGVCIRCYDNCRNCTENGCMQCYNQDAGVSLFEKVCYDCSYSKYGNGCLKCNNTKCLECKTGSYYLKLNGYCEACSSLCNKCNAQDGCTECRNEDHGVSLNNGVCYDCKVFGDCEACTAKTCTRCSDSNYFANEQGVCYQCADLCNTCTGLQQCTECAASADRFISLHEGICYKCSSNCQKCTSTAVCTVCESNYTPINGACERCDASCKQCKQAVDKCVECADGYVKNATDDRCYRCSLITNCDACEVVDNKLKCYSGKCASDYYQTSLEEYTEQCVKCPANCKICYSSNVCYICNEYYAPDGVGYCYLCSKIPNCKICEFSLTKGAMVCSLGGCNERYHSYDGKCEVCHATNCNTCVKDQPYACEKCTSDTMVPFNYVCTACSSVIPNCAQCEIVESEYKCLKCTSPYNLSYDRRRCANCYGIVNCYACDTVNPDRCAVCNNLYKLENDGHECNAWDQTECDKIFYKPEFGKAVCIKCWPNMHMIYTVCYACKQSSCKTCLSDLTTCTECTDNISYTLGSDGICRSNCLDSNCIECQDTPGYCYQCDTGYYTLDGQCIACTPNCDICDHDASVCEKCANGLLQSPEGKCGQCGELIEHCATCQSLDGIASCAGCVKPYVLSPDHSQCVDSCSLISDCYECSFGLCVSCYYPNVVSADGLRCESTITNCETHDAELPACTKCDAGYYLDGAVCRPCNGKYANCHLCDAESCTECSDGFYMASDNQFCGTCRDVDGCVACAPADPNKCAECDSPLLPSVDGRACHECTSDANCVACASAEACGVCADGMRPLLGRLCVYGNCSAHCDICDASGKCLLCAAGYWAEDGVCVQDTCAERVMGMCVSCIGGYTLNGIACTPSSKRSAVDALEAIAISTATLGCIVATGAVALSVIHRNKAKANGRASALSQSSTATGSTDAPQPKELAPRAGAPATPVRRVKRKIAPRALGTVDLGINLI